MINDISELEELYVSLPEAVARVHGDKSRVDGLPFPTGNPGARYAVFPRQVATPTHEVRRFLSIAEAHGLEPLFFEYHADRFVTRNLCKFSLARMRFTDDPDHKGIDCVLTTIDIQAAQGRPLGALSTLWGEPLVTFHHKLLRESCPGLDDGAFYDGSGWFRSYGGTPIHYYRHFLSLFISQAVLFETYLMDREEARFTTDIVFPAFKYVRDTFGRKPLVVRLDPQGMEGHPFWLSYPKQLEKSLVSQVNGTAPRRW